MNRLNHLDLTIEARLCHSLSSVLRDGIDIHRCVAAQALGRLQPKQPEAVDALIDALLDEDPDVRADAAAAVARLGDPKCGPPLLENLIGDPCADVKLAALEALIRMRHPEIVPWLRRLLNGRDPDIVWDDEEFYADGWDDWTDIQLRALAGLAELGVEEAVPDITAAIDDEFGQDLLEPGFAALVRLGEPGSSALDHYLANGNPKMRRRVAGALGATAKGAQSAAMNRALADPAPEVRLAAARAIAARDPADDRLSGLFRDATAMLRAEAARLCGSAYPDQVLGLLDDGDPAVRRAALAVMAEAPHRFAAASATGILLTTLRGPDGALAALAAKALAAVAPTDAVEELCALVGDEDRPAEARAGAAKALARLAHLPGERVENALVAVTGEPDRPLRLAAMAGLLANARAGEDWPNVAGAALLAALRGALIPAPAAEREPPPEPVVGSEAEEAPEGSAPAFPTSTLEAILGGDAQLPAQDSENGAPVELTQADIDRLALAERTPRKRRVPVTPKIAPHLDLRRIAARLVGDLPHEDVASALVEALDDGDAEVRLAAMDSLARIADRLRTFPAEVTQRLIAALENADREARLYAIRALGAAGGAETAGVVRKLLCHEDSFIRSEAVRALSRLGKTGPDIAALLSDPDRSVRLAAAEAISAEGGDDAVGQLFEFAFSFGGVHRSDAGRLSRGIDAPAASSRFLDVLDRPERVKQWQVAIEALVELNQPQQTTAAGGRIS